MDTTDLINYLLTPAAQVLLIIALAEAVKKMKLFDKRFIPLLDLILGVISGVFVFGVMQGLGWKTGALIGVALGLSACGLFSGIKNITK